MTTDVQTSHIFKILLIGDSGVGKTSLLNSFVKGTFEEHTKNTVGVDLKIKTFVLQNHTVKLSIWDTAGQERFRTLTSAYYRGAHGIICAYDMTCRTSFDNLSFWLKEVDHYSTNLEAVKLLVANKVDRKEERTVSAREGLEFAREMESLYIEASAKTQEGVQQAFEELVQKILENPVHQQQSKQNERQHIIVEPESGSGLLDYCLC